MRGGLPLFRFRGIKVLVHWSFLLLPAYIAFTGLQGGSSWGMIGTDVGLVLIVFLCVVLHEFGHALTAQRFGVGTRDITLLPIGGVASLERMPEDPKQEFWITIAGPLVNLVIAGLALLVMAISGMALLFTDAMGSITSWSGVLIFIFTANLGLFLFNLVPAFPMDGGRILRSLLSMWIPREKATRIATTVGRVLAVGFVAYGLLQGEPFLAIIGIFIFMAAGAERKQVIMRDRVKALLVSEVMITPVLQLPADMSLQEAWNALTFGDHKALVAKDASGYLGIVLREDMQTALTNGLAGKIRALVRPAIRVHTTDAALPLYQQMVNEGSLAYAAMDGDQLVGVVLRSALVGTFNAEAGSKAS